MNLLITGCCGHIGSYLVNNIHKIKKIKKTFIVDNFNSTQINSLFMSKKKNNLKFYKLDLTKMNSLDKLGKIDYIIHLASLTNAEGSFDSKNEMYKNNISCMKNIINFCKKKKSKLIHISSIQGVSAPKFEHYKGLKMNSPIAYTAIKSGIIAITKYLAKYYGKNNIQVNCISPGGIKDSQPKVFVKRYKNSCLSKGLLEINDLQPIVFFLTSDNSKYINGQNIIIDDGWSL